MHADTWRRTQAQDRGGWRGGRAESGGTHEHVPPAYLHSARTCSRASRVRARWLKISMMSPTLSSTGSPHAACAGSARDCSMAGIGHAGGRQISGWRAARPYSRSAHLLCLAAAQSRRHHAAARCGSHTAPSVAAQHPQRALDWRRPLPHLQVALLHARQGSVHVHSLRPVVHGLMQHRVHKARAKKGGGGGLEALPAAHQHVRAGRACRASGGALVSARVMVWLLAAGSRAGAGGGAQRRAAQRSAA